MATIREIGEADLERFVAVVALAMPREEMGGVAGSASTGAARRRT